MCPIAHQDQNVSEINSESAWALYGCVEARESAPGATNYDFELHAVTLVPKCLQKLEQVNCNLK